MKEYELIIIGQGPAGLSAAIYTARAGVKTLLLGCDPKVAGDYDIDNYFGFPETITGRDLIARGVAQAERFGTDLSCQRVLSIHPAEDGWYTVKTELDEFRTCAVILATGVSRKRPVIENLEAYEGKGVSYCVSCDAFFFKNKKVVVAGEGIFAANQALELKEYTPHVSICTMGKEAAINGDFMGRLAGSGIEVLNGKILRLAGEPGLKRIIFEDGTERETDGLFIAMGDASSIDFAYSLGIFTEGVFIQADREGRTNVPGVFAAGDCVGGFLQISKAVGEGALAARSAIDYVRSHCRR
ncbi:MAG: NAD(P)/FAD-dependent oxidoreductase [Spirochaetes bacterium]|nr:NAD(P)/FAD-dependent oxidoreductase [Spirochaetota bacterium]